MTYLYILKLKTENTLRVLQRISTIFSRNRVNIEKMNVFETNVKGVSHFDIEIYTSPEAISKLLKQLKKIVELIEVSIFACNTQ